jgi:hypothetical protein
MFSICIGEQSGAGSGEGLCCSGDIMQTISHWMCRVGWQVFSLHVAILLQIGRSNI